MMFTMSNSFPDDPYGWLTNQISHIALGVFLVFFVCFSYFWAVGEYPIKEHALIVIFAGYLVFELWFQGWNGWDTLEDTAFVVGYGSCSALAVSSEKVVGSSEITMQLGILPIVFTLIALHLFFGYRWRRKNQI